MSVAEENTSRDDQRFARLNALYDAYLRHGDAEHPSGPEHLNEDVVEVACEFAPAVRRRTRRTPH